MSLIIIMIIMILLHPKGIYNTNRQGKYKKQQQYNTIVIYINTVKNNDGKEEEKVII